MDVVVLAGTDWGPLWQGAQELSSRLARAGHRVLFVENLGARGPGWRDAGQVMRRMGAWMVQARRNRGGGVRATPVAPRLWVHSPLALPPFGTPRARATNRRIFLPRIQQVAAGLGMQDVVVITLLATDSVLDLVSLFRSDRSRLVYWCTTDVSALDPEGPGTPRGKAMVDAERTLLHSADLVLAPVQALAHRCAAGSSRVRLFPHGVDLDAFPFAPPPAEPQSPPLIGYVGGLHRHVDYELLARCAARRPEWRWEFVGPQQSPKARVLAKLENVRLLGALSHHELGAHIARWSACMVPYERNPYTATVVPTKLNEYLAVGRPVVATRLPSVAEFAAAHEGVFTAENEPESFLRALEEALLSGSDPRAALRRRAVAALHSWEARMDDLEGWLEGGGTAV